MPKKSILDLVNLNQLSINSTVSSTVIHLKVLDKPGPESLYLRLS